LQLAYKRKSPKLTEFRARLNLKTLLLLLLITVSPHKFLNSARRIDDFLLSSIKRVGKGTYLDVDYKMLDSIDGSSFFRSHGRDTLPLMLSINKEHGMVHGMRCCLHFNSPAATD